ncbi:MAG: DUF3306 domain-containing protein [Rhodocyclaceae bacterium]|nr:DUF3306 domain-containing protein [Rhodocyclaceae bacterium]
MSGGESFFGRWSRLKRAAGELPANPAEAAPALPLPDPETLGFDDDFRAFLRREVEEGVRRVALKKLFHSPQFNVMDGLDVYIDDYSIASPLDAATLRQIEHARELVFGERPAEAAAGAAGNAVRAEAPAQLSVPQPAALAPTMPADEAVPAAGDRVVATGDGDAA